MKIERIVSQYLESNTYVVKKNGQCLIVDGGAELGDVKKAVGSDKVMAILLTHGHFDHAFNILQYAEEFNCKIYASPKAKINLSDPAKNYGKGFKIDEFSRFVFIDDGDELSLGDFDIEVFALPGHCKCALGYLIESTLFAGDVLFARAYGRIDLWDSSQDEMLASLRKLTTIPFAQVASGHGEMSTAQSQARNLKTFIRFLSR